MSDRKVVAIAGATGHVGARHTELLLAGGHAVRAIARGSERLDALAARGAEPHAGSLEDASFLTDAFTGADVVFAMLPPNYAAPDHRAFQRAIGDAEATAVAAAGVPRAVMLSSVGAHHPGGTGPVTGLVKSAGINGMSVAADVALPTVATRDIADVAATVIAGKEAPPVRYILGPRDLTFPEATRILGESIGLPELPYVVFSPEDELQGLIGAGLSPSVAADLVEMHGGMNQGLFVPTIPRSPETTSPTTLEQWAPTFAAAYAGAG